jgi:hypothetical protein
MAVKKFKEKKIRHQRGRQPGTMMKRTLPEAVFFNSWVEA